MSKKPVIGVSMRLELETDRFYLGRDYTEALEALGAVPVHVSLIPDPDYIRSVIGLVDGVLLPGSDTDVDPFRFGEEPRPGLKRIIPEKERTDLLLLEEIERTAKPLLGICFGMQILNVARGGTLVQDIESEISGCLKHEQGKPLARGSHSISVVPGSLIAGLVGEVSGYRVNSHHHQAVGRIGQNLRITASALDGVPECIEDIRSDRFVLGVQWHPELSWKSDRGSRAVFESFVAACSNDG